MDILARITIPDYIYHFYANASHCIRAYAPEDVMADALIAYAAMLSSDVAKILHTDADGAEKINSAISSDKGNSPSICEQIVTVSPQP